MQNVFVCWKRTLMSEPVSSVRQHSSWPDSYRTVTSVVLASYERYATVRIWRVTALLQAFFEHAYLWCIELGSHGDANLVFCDQGE